jgi:hypothetical protein
MVALLNILATTKGGNDRAFDPVGTIPLPANQRPINTVSVMWLTNGYKLIFVLLFISLCVRNLCVRITKVV